MAAPWHDAIVLVTGASSGIGLELARRMAPRARGMALVARRRERLEELAKELSEMRPELEVHVRPTDLVDLDDCARMLDEVFEALGPIDVLVNNAGLGDIGAFDLSDWDKLERMIRVNVLALTFLSHRLYPGMVERRRGGILNVSSGFGHESLPSFGTYVGTKHYVTGLTECLHVEARGLGVAVTELAPGPVRTEFEEVAGNFTGREVPSLLQIEAGHCARAGLAGFARGRALVYPGAMHRLQMLAGAITPGWVKRLLYRPSARWMRERQLTAGAGPTSQ